MMTGVYMFYFKTKWSQVFVLLIIKIKLFWNSCWVEGGGGVQTFRDSNIFFES